MEKVTVLMKLAEEYLETGEQKKALKIGARLRKLRYSGAYEIIARAHYEEKDIKKAIKVLREGLAIFPGVWILWVQLGNYLSDLELHSEALNAYDMARKCPVTDLTQVDLNAAVLSFRMKRFNDAILLCRGVLEKEPAALYRLRALVVIIQSLGETGQGEESLALGEEAKSLVGQCSEPDADDASQLYSALAQITWRVQQDRAPALQYVRTALSYSRINAVAADLLREISGRVTQQARHYQVLVWGNAGLMPDLGKRELYTSYGVVADTPEEALELIREFELHDFRHTFRIEESRDDGPADGEHHGVCSVTGLVFYPAEQ